MKTNFNPICTSHEYQAHRGPVEVVRVIALDTTNGGWFLIKAEDGWEGAAHGDELEPCSGCGQIRAVSVNGLCPACKAG